MPSWKIEVCRQWLLSVLCSDTIVLRYYCMFMAADCKFMQQNFQHVHHCISSLEYKQMKINSSDRLSLHHVTV